MSNYQLDINHVRDSPKGTRFMLPSPGPEADGRKCWDDNLSLLFDHYLERSKNRSVLTGMKRENYLFWLRNSSAPLRGETKEEKARDANDRTQALRHFELQDDQVYRKAEIIKGTLFPDRYVVCVWDSFSIICRIHRALCWIFRCLRLQTKGAACAVAYITAYIGCNIEACRQPL